jgi:hypothetical protein
MKFDIWVFFENMSRRQNMQRRMIRGWEWWIDKDVEQSGRDLLDGVFPHIRIQNLRVRSSSANHSAVTCDGVTSTSIRLLDTVFLIVLPRHFWILLPLSKPYGDLQEAWPVSKSVFGFHVRFYQLQNFDGRKTWQTGLNFYCCGR